MRIAVNTRLLIKNKLEGIGRFTFEILKQLSTNNPNIEFHFIFDRKFSNEFIFSKNVTPHILAPQTRHPLLWYIWLEIKLPRLINKINPDVFLSLDGFMSTKIHTTTIIAIHDINFEHRPKDLKWAHSIFYRRYMKKYAQLADHVITVSNFSKKDIVKRYKINSEKVSVVYNGVSSVFSPISKEHQIKIRNQYSKGQEFFVFIGSLHKRKNIKNLLLAFDLFRNKNKTTTTNLLIIGEKKWWDRHTENTYQTISYKNNVLFLGKMKDEDMALILASTKALCFTSIFEGFGLPIVEAMAAGVPVITSNTSSMPEIAQDSALIVNPFKIKEIQAAMSKIDTDEMLRSELIKKGQQRVKHFDWEKSSKKVLHIINNHHK